VAVRKRHREGKGTLQLDRCRRGVGKRAHRNNNILRDANRGAATVGALDH